MDLSPLGGVLLAHWPIDWLAVLALVIVFALDSMRSGSSRAIAVSIAAPVTSLFLNWLNGAAFIGDLVGQFSTAPAQAGLFAVLFVGLSVIFYRIVYAYADTSGLLKPLLIGLCTTIILTITWIHTPALSALWHFSVSVHAVFASAYVFWWMLAAYIGLAAARS